MKFSVTPSASGGYCTANGKTVTITPAAHGIDYASEAAAASALNLTERSLFFAKKTALNAANREAELPVMVAGISMRTNAATQMQMNNLVTLLGLAKDQQPDEPSRNAFLAMMIGGITGPVLDSSDVGHDMTVANVFGFTVLYGQAVGAARMATLQKIAAIEAAQSIEDLP